MSMVCPTSTGSGQVSHRSFDLFSEFTKNMRRNWKPVGAFLMIGLALFFASYYFLDSDLGWHLRMGELILKDGFPRTDRFSYTMPSFPFADSEWLTGVVVYLSGGEKAGRIGLALVETLVKLTAFYLCLKGVDEIWQGRSLKKDTENAVLAGLLICAGVFSFYYRTLFQIASLLFTALLLYLSGEERRWRRWRWWLPLLFLVWANLHGAFALGLVTLAIIIAARSWERKKPEAVELGILGAAVLVTLVNPYGGRLWEEAVRTAGSASLRSYIQEWMPPIYFSNFGLPALIGLAGVLVIRYRKKLAPVRLWLSGFFFLISLTAQRHVSLLVLATIPVLGQSFWWFYQEIKGDRVKRERFLVAQRVFLGLALGLFLYQAKTAIGNAREMTEAKFYPGEAVGYLRENLPEGEIFSSYNWGGYLLWKLPEKKVFLDGRMASWEWRAPEGESNSAFEESQAILSGEIDWERALEKYQVKTVLWPKVKLKTRLSFRDKLERELGNLFKETVSDGGLGFIQRLEAAGWRRVYEDEKAWIYQIP